MVAALKNIFKRYPLFLLTIPLFIVVHIEQQYYHLIQYRFVYREIIYLFIPPVIVILLGYLIFRHLGKAGIFSFTLLLIYYFFGDLKDWLHALASKSIIFSYAVLLPLLVVFIVVCCMLLKTSSSSFKRTILFINTAFILFIAGDLLMPLINPATQNKDRGDQHKTISHNYKPCDTCSKPDIYYILFDAYTSSAVLQSDFGYHNNIDSFLQSKQFFVVDRSRSNYNLTPFSISSCFNLQYLPGLNVSQDFYMDGYMPGVQSVYKSELIPILEKEGYDIVNHSIFTIEGHPPVTPVYDVWDVDHLYSYHNIFRKIDEDIGWSIRRRFPAITWKWHGKDYVEQRDDHLEKTLTAFRQTIQTTPARPRFVYTHFVLPHAPYNYDTSGKKTNQGYYYLTIPQKQQAYVLQVAYANKLMREFVETIFSHSSRPLVIVIQGDHGFRFGNGPKKDLEFPNLNALYFSNGDYRLLNDSMTNVNTFRVVFNTFFHQQFPLLKDTSYFLNYK
jgi:hypothetical protein